MVNVEQLWVVENAIVNKCRRTIHPLHYLVRMLKLKANSVQDVASKDDVVRHGTRSDVTSQCLREVPCWRELGKHNLYKVGHCGIGGGRVAFDSLDVMSEYTSGLETSGEQVWRDIQVSGAGVKKTVKIKRETIVKVSLSHKNGAKIPIT